MISHPHRSDESLVSNQPGLTWIFLLDPCKEGAKGPGDPPLLLHHFQVFDLLAPVGPLHLLPTGNREFRQQRSAPRAVVFQLETQLWSLPMKHGMFDVLSSCEPPSPWSCFSAAGLMLLRTSPPFGG